MRNTSEEKIEFWRQLDEWIDRDPDLAWRILVELSGMVKLDEVGRIGAGPLEELLVTHDSYVPRAAELATTDTTFRSMLSCVTPSGMSEGME